MTLTLAQLDTQTADEIGSDVLIEYARERAARERCEALLKPGDRTELIRYGNGTYSVVITRSFPNDMTFGDAADSPTEAYLALAMALETR
jgi:hypothetical protein